MNYGGVQIAAWNAAKLVATRFYLTNGGWIAGEAGRWPLIEGGFDLHGASVSAVANDNDFVFENAFRKDAALYI